MLGPDVLQLSLLAQIQGGTLSPRSARNVIQGDPNLHPTVLRGIIDAMAETTRRVENWYAVKKGLLEEALNDLQKTSLPSRWVDTKHPFEEAPPGYKEN